MTRQNQRSYKYLKLFGDYFIFLACYPVSYFIRFILLKSSAEQVPFERYQIQFLITSYVFIFIMYMFDLYNTKKSLKLYDETAKIFFAHSLTLFVLLFMLYLSKSIDVSRLFILIYFFSSFLFIMLFRTFLRFLSNWFFSRGRYRKSVLLIGINDLSHRYFKEATKDMRLGIDIRYILDDKPAAFSDMPISGRISELESILISDDDLDQVIIGLRPYCPETVMDMIDICEKHGIRSAIIPEYQEILPARPDYDEVADIILVNTRNIPLDNIFNKFLKRTLDILLSVILIIICLPIYIVIASLIKITSPGPVIFKQKRIGYNRKEFTMYKFRSMDIQPDNEEKDRWSRKNDERVTKIGRFIRVTSLDETPQFINVLIGDMSLVGPRPERKQFVDRFCELIPKYNIKHRVKPGITGLAQINGYRGDTSISERIKYDLNYIEEWSFQLEIYILIKTLLYGFFNKHEA